MPTIDIMGTKREFRCTSRTLTIYEQAFHSDENPKVTGDMIADVMGKQRLDEDSGPFLTDDDGNIVGVIIDFTADNWNAEKRALWAMLKTQSEIDDRHGVEHERVPSYFEWDRMLVEWEPNMREVSNIVGEELNRGLFRAGAAASE